MSSVSAQDAMISSRALYGAAFDPGTWSVAAGALKEAVGAMAATLVVGTGDGAYQTVHSDCDPYYSDLYWRDLAPRDFMLAGPGGEGAGCDVYTNQMVLEDRRFPALRLVQRTAVSPRTGTASC
ncbi:hypothetical protein CDEF62S_04349 [Castellaniella defragrans]